MPNLKRQNIGKQDLQGQHFPKSKRKNKCEYPEKLKGKPEECSSEQIKECHGETIKHPCI